MGPDRLVAFQRTKIQLTSFTVVRRLAFPLVGAPEEGPTAPAADAAVVSPERVVRRGCFAANGTDLDFIDEQIEPNVLLELNH